MTIEVSNLSNLSNFSTATNLLRGTYFQRSYEKVEKCLAQDFSATRTFSTGPIETFNKIEYCKNKIDGIWNGPLPRTMSIKAVPIEGRGTRTDIFCYEFDDKGGPLNKPVLYGMSEPKTCKSFIAISSEEKMVALEEQVNIYIIRKKDFSKVLVTDENKEDLSNHFEEYIQLTDSKLIEQLAGKETGTRQLEVVINLIFFSFINQKEDKIEKFLSDDFEASIRFSWNHDKEKNKLSKKKYLNKIKNYFFDSTKVMALISMTSRFEKENKIISCVRLLQTGNSADGDKTSHDCNPLGKPLLYLINNRIKTKQFTKPSLEELPQIKKLSHKIEFYVMKKEKDIPILITPNNRENLKSKWQDYHTADTSQENANHMAVSLSALSELDGKVAF